MEAGGRRGPLLARVALAAAAAVVTVNIWTGAPLLALWVGSQAAGPSGLSMTAVLLVIVVLVALVLALVRLLAAINARYDELAGRPQMRRVAPWLRSMRGEREEWARQRPSAVERAVVAAVTVGVLAFNAWFFFLAGSPLGNA